ncbi:MAG: type II restriction endonuclease [Rikenellaceae bacterium]
MNTYKDIPIVTEIPDDELKAFDKLIKKYRGEYIRSSKQIVDNVIESNIAQVESSIERKNASEAILFLRERCWAEFLKDEVCFNSLIMRDLRKIAKTPEVILNDIVEKEVWHSDKEELLNTVKDVCGEYAGRIFPYIYKLSLSNTQSRRTRAGKTFEEIIYWLYQKLSYPYDSQSKVGRKLFDSVGLGKKVDSILPGIKNFTERRNKTIIGTMKTSLRERWQEVAEEIQRTNVPEIHLLTCDDNIPENKALEIANHNITIVTFSWVADSESLKNIISFEEYFFTEIPNILRYWNE